MTSNRWSPLLDGCAALIHLAAIPAPVGHPPEVVFANNTQATYAALEAAGDGGDHPVRDRLQRLGLRDRVVAAADQAPLRAGRRGPPDDQLRTVRAVQGGRRADGDGDGPSVRDVGGGAAVPLDRDASAAARLRREPAAVLGTGPTSCATCGATSTCATPRRPAGWRSRRRHGSRTGSSPMNIVAADTLVARADRRAAGRARPRDRDPRRARPHPGRLRDRPCRAR